MNSKLCFCTNINIDVFQSLPNLYKAEVFSILIIFYSTNFQIQIFSSAPLYIVYTVYNISQSTTIVSTTALSA